MEIQVLLPKANGKAEQPEYKPAKQNKLYSILTFFCHLSRHYREGNGIPLQYSNLENPISGGAWWAAVNGVAKSPTRLSHSLSLFTFMHWRKKWQPTPVFMPGESPGWQSLVGCCLWGHTESDTTEVT